MFVGVKYMKMKTNLEKYNHYKDIVDNKTMVFIISVLLEDAKKLDLPDIGFHSVMELMPERFYTVSYNGEIKENIITGVAYSHPMVYYFHYNKPTKEDIEKIKNYSESEIKFEKEKIRIEYCYFWGNNSKASSSISIEKLKESFETKEKAELFSIEMKEKFEEEKLFRETNKKDSSYNYTANGYKFLGWQNGWKNVYFDEDGNVTDDPKKRKSFGYLTSDYPEYGLCRDLKHRRIEVSHNQRGSENTVSCPLCKIYWKYDSSD